MISHSPTLEIQGVRIGEEFPTYFVADIGANHDGMLRRAEELVFSAAEAGASAAKFQHFSADSIVSDYGFKALGRQQSHQNLWTKSVYEVYKAASIDLDWTSSLKEICDRAGIAFFTSPYSLSILDAVDSYVPAYKIGSGDITWIEMVRSIAAKQKPYLLATGASSMDDVIRAVDVGLSLNTKLCLMQCNTNYTASLDNYKHIQLNVLKVYRNMFPGLVLGLSDHTQGHSTVLGAVALGARIIEKHFTDDTNRDGPDHRFSMDPISWREMVDRTRELEQALGTGIKKVEPNERETVILQRRAIRAAMDIPKGAVLNGEHFALLRPCPEDGLPPYLLERVLGRSTKMDIAAGEHFKWTHFL